MSDPVRRIWRSHVGEVGPESHLQINDLNVCVSCWLEHFRGGWHSSLNDGSVEARTVEHSALGAKIVLRVHDHHYCLRQFESERPRLCPEGYATPIASSRPPRIALKTQRPGCGNSGGQTLLREFSSIHRTLRVGEE